MPARIWAAALCLLATIALACGGDSSPSPSPTGPLPSPTDSADAQCEDDLGAAVAAVHVNGGFEVDYLGDRFSLATGDFNGDGDEDALLGAPLADGPNDERLNSGEAYVLFGGPSLPNEIDAPGGMDVVIYGRTPQDNLGLSVAAGDVNDDGTDDILVGARFASVGERNQVGETYVVFGGADLAATIDIAASEQDVTIIGSDVGDFSGIIVHAADVTDDGVDDVIIGAIGGFGPDGDRARAGELYVVPGGRDLDDLDIGEEGAFFTAYGAFQDDALPGRIAAGDINRDGRNELIIGVPHAAPGGDPALVSAGMLYAVSVPDAGGVLDLAHGDPLLAVKGARQRDGLGHSLAVADINHDGAADLLVGARDADGPQGGRNNAGEVYAFFGDPKMPREADLAVDQPDLRLTGADPDDSLGFSLAAADVTGDGVADILAGAPLAGGCGNARPEAGEVQVVAGRSGISGDIDLRDADAASRTLSGPEDRDEAGFSLAAADIDGDGHDDIIIGALLADGPDNRRPEAGEVFIVSGE